MKFLRAMQYLGITLLMGCTIGLLFTIIFMIVIPIEITQALMALGIFASYGTLGLIIIKSSALREKYEVQINEKI